jgi:hypothetical protein
MTRTKVKQYLGVDIWLDSDNGKFSAVIDGNTRELSSLKSVESAVRKAAQGVNVIVLSSFRDDPATPEEPVVVRVLRSDGRDLFDQSNHRVWGEAYVYEEDALEKLRESKRKYDEMVRHLALEWSVIWEGLRSGLRRADANEIARALRAAELDH